MNINTRWLRPLTLLPGLLLLSSPSLAAPKAELWPYWQATKADSAATIDHAAWSEFLGKYSVTDADPHRLRYGEVSAADKKALNDYVAALEAVKIRDYNRAEQRAYWINLYNAATVDLVLEKWPVESITKIKPSFFAFGPWEMKLLKVEGKELSLNDIEHRILRPIWDDNRVHYAVNCASIGCPSLAATAFTAANMDALLDESARAFVNSPRGVSIKGGELTVSSIYKWFDVDFGGSDAGILKHLKQYAEPDLAKQLAAFSEIDADSYDWGINSP